VKQTVGAASGTAERALRSLERRVRGSLDGHTAIGRRRSSGATSRPRRKVTDPERLERRRQALAKARERFGRRSGWQADGKSAKMLLSERLVNVAPSPP
jgi:hypothetical protein